MFKYVMLFLAALIASASAKPLVYEYAVPVAAAYTDVDAVAAAYTAPLAYSSYSAYSAYPAAYSAYSYASPYSTYYI